MRRPSTGQRRMSTAEDRMHSLESEYRVLKARLGELTDQVTRNDSLLRKTQERELELLRARSLPELLERLIHGLKASHRLEVVTLALQDPQHEIRHLLAGDGPMPDELRDILFADALITLDRKSVV